MQDHIRNILNNARNRADGIRGDHRRLVVFSRVMGVGIPLVFGVAIPLIFGHSFMVWPVVAGLIFLGLGILAPESLLWPMVVWLALGEVMHHVNSFIIFGAMFFIVICPLGLIFRMAGKDPLKRRPDSRTDSYRITISDDNPLNRLNNTY